MSARVTIDRVLRDGDDASGQSVRQWKIEAESGHVTIRTGSAGFLLIRTDDVNLFVQDLNQAVEAAAELAPE